jgi:hypothetical protein
LTFFHVSPACRSTRRMPFREASRPRAWETHRRTFFSRLVAQ